MNNKALAVVVAVVVAAALVVSYVALSDDGGRDGVSVDNSNHIVRYEFNFAHMEAHDGIKMLLNGSPLNLETYDEFSLSGEQTLTLQYDDSCTGWTWNESAGAFEFTAGDKPAAISLSVTNAGPVTAQLVDGTPTFKFTPSGNVEIVITERPR